MATIEKYEAIEPDLLLKFYPGEERRIDFCICLQTKEKAFTHNYIVLLLYGKKAKEFDFFPILIKFIDAKDNT